MNSEKTQSKFGAFIKKITGSTYFPLIILYIIMCIIFTVWSKLLGYNFLKISTFRNILTSIVVTSFLTIGSGWLLIAGHIDLSQSAVGCFGGIVIASALANFHLPLIVAILLMIVICGAFGAFNAFMITKLEFPSFIATLATASIASGLMYLYSMLGSDATTATNINFDNDFLYALANYSFHGIPYSVMVMVVFFVIYGILVSKTQLGAKVNMLGGNPVAANMAGINATALMFMLCINASVLGGVSGLFSASRMVQGSLRALGTNQFTGITACILGGISFGGGKGGMFGAFLGLLILNTFQVGMSTLGLSTYWVNVFSGLLLIIALMFDFLSNGNKSILSKLTARKAASLNK